MRIFEKGFNYSQDGPGNRLVYHLVGCNMRCPWCSNPEGMIENPNAVNCPEAEMAEEIISCMPMFFDGGGVTFTGGECSLQADEIINVINKIKCRNISVAIESNAFTGGFLSLAPLCDYVMVDFKSPDAKTLETVTNADISVIKANIESVLQVQPLHIRVPFIHGFNDSEQSVAEFADYFKSLKSISDNFDVEILPYHEYGKEKWQNLHREYTVANGFVTPNVVKSFKNLLINSKIKVIET